MPMIAHQRMSAIAPAPLYSAASARVAAYEDEMFEPAAPQRPSYKYANSFMEDTVNATMQVSELSVRASSGDALPGGDGFDASAWPVIASSLPASDRTPDDVNGGSRRSRSRSPFERQPVC